MWHGWKDGRLEWGCTRLRFDGVTEVAGLATLEPFRRRGIATGLTALAVQRAMEQGAKVVCLTAADERAGRVYEQVGFVGYATMLAYLDSLSD